MTRREKETSIRLKVSTHKRLYDMLFKGESFDQGINRLLTLYEEYLENFSKIPGNIEKNLEGY